MHNSGDRSNKRQLEGGEDFESSKEARTSETLERRETMEAQHVISTDQSDEPDHQHQADNLEVLSIVETNQPHNQHLAKIQPDLSSPINHDIQEMTEGLNTVSVVQTGQPDDENKPEDLNVDSLIGPFPHDLTMNCLLRISRSDYGALALINKTFHALVRSGFLYRARRKAGIVEHWIYFSCNLVEWEAFDPVHARWMRLPRTIYSECFMCSDKESLAVGTDLLVFGKEITSHAIYRYSLLTNTWTSGMKMNTTRCLFGSASLGGIAIVAGGWDPIQKCLLSSAELYDLETGTWTTIPSMNKPRKMSSGVFMDGKFYVIGGTGEANQTLTCGEVYDLETHTWKEIPGSMFPTWNEVPGSAPPLVAVVKNELYAADHAEQVVRKYDKETNAWITLGRLPERANSTNGWGMGFKACGDRLIVIGGPMNLGVGMIELNSWIPSEGPPQWNLLVRRPSGSFVYNCAVMGC